MAFEPRDKIVFNAPFDEMTITYQMKVTNTCRRVRGEARGSLQFIGFAIKCNAIPRLTAKPAFGVIRPGQTLHINVTLDVPSSPLPS